MPQARNLSPDGRDELRGSAPDPVRVALAAGLGLSHETIRAALNWGDATDIR